MVWSRRPVYCCLHWALSWLVLGLDAPFGTGSLFFPAIQRVKLGGSGTAAWPTGCPGWPAACCREVAASQWLNSALVIEVSPTLATEPAGTSLPQPAMA